MTRPLLWVLAGLVVLVAGMVATAPELLGDVSIASGVVLLAFAAGVPGLVTLLIAGLARRRRLRAERVAQAATSTPADPGHPAVASAHLDDGSS